MPKGYNRVGRTGISITLTHGQHFLFLSLCFGVGVSASKGEGEEEEEECAMCKYMCNAHPTHFGHLGFVTGAKLNPRMRDSGVI